jgi:manganese-dependent inorganic pyrophosphatase
LNAIVMPYIDPDLDGVACAIAVAALEGDSWSARALGAIDDETREVLQALSLSQPTVPPEWSTVQRVWLVDTHHPTQLPADLPFDRVVRITDHHPAGSPERFPAAQIQNETVGAAASLVAERYFGAGKDIPPTIACLLQAAILSNTLNFRAPASSSRDKDMFAALARISPLADAIVQAMSAARRFRLALDTARILEIDVKIFATAEGPIAVAQFESSGALELLERANLVPCLQVLAKSHAASAAILNLVDLEKCHSAVVCTDLAILDMLSRRLRGERGGEGLIRIDRLIQRKTDIAPYLT